MHNSKGIIKIICLPPLTNIYIFFRNKFPLGFWKLRDFIFLSCLMECMGTYSKLPKGNDSYFSFFCRKYSATSTDSTDTVNQKYRSKYNVIFQQVRHVLNVVGDREPCCWSAWKLLVRRAVTVFEGWLRWKYPAVTSAHGKRNQSKRSTSGQIWPIYQSHFCIQKAECYYVTCENV